MTYYKYLIAWKGALRISGKGPVTLLTPSSLPREINSHALSQGSPVIDHSCSDDNSGWDAQNRILQWDDLFPTRLDMATLRVFSRWSTSVANLCLGL